MTKQRLIRTTVVALLALAGSPAPARAAAPRKQPNVVFILADDLGYGDLGAYGQKKIKTPRLDRMAAEGVRFTQFYAGSTVCAPSRASLMTGLHQGHARVRGNGKAVPLEPGDVTVAEVLKSAGYATALVGKWGLGDSGTTGVPTRQGFDYFYGYLDQVHAHDYYTDHLFKNEDKVSLAPGSYSHDLFTKEAREFVQRSKDAPFFLYLAYTTPHANNEKKDKGMQVPSDEPYTAQPWPEQERNFAAMVTRLDRDVGALLDLLRELKLAQDTVVFFTSDNGAHKEGGHDANFFQSSGALRGIKRAMYEGGIRVPMIVWAPGRVPAGKVSDAVWANWDVLPTLAALAGAKPPAGLDGVAQGDLLRTGKSRPHAPLYWEFHEGGFKQAARVGDFKGIRQAPGQPLELYDLRHDVGEITDVAARNAKVVAQMEAFITEARTESPHWPTPAAKPK